MVLSLLKQLALLALASAFTPMSVVGAEAPSGSVPALASASVPMPFAWVASLGTASRLRLHVRGDCFVMKDCRVDDRGVTGSIDLNTSRSITASRFETLQIEWSQVERIDRPHSHVVRGAVIGFALGLAVGSYAAAHERAYSMADQTGGAADPLAAQRVSDLLVTTAAGALTGAIVGIFTSDWKRVAP